MADDIGVGDTVGQYRILKVLGAGGMGQVFVAEHGLIGRRAAVKVLKPDLSERRDIIDRFFNEARASSMIGDPGIVQAFDFGFHTTGAAYIVMELLDGETLEARIKQQRVIQPEQALRLMRQAASTLAAVHAKGIVHRDLKPANMVIVTDREAVGGERLKILDFGIAKLMHRSDSDMNTTGDTVMGTPFYMSPEQAKADRSLDHRTDIYALGGVLYHMLVGAPPFRSNTLAGMITAHLSETPKRPSQSVIGLPSGLDDIVSRCLEKSPAARFQTMLELAAECDAMLMRLAGGEPFGHTVPIGPTRATTDSATTLASAAGVHEILASPPRRRRRWAVLASALLVVGAAAAGVLIFGGRPTHTAAAPRAAARHVEVPASVVPVPPAPAPAPAPAPVAVPTPTPTAPPVAETGSAASQPAPVAEATTKTTPLRKKTKAVTQRKRTTTTKQAEDLYDDR